MTLGELLSSMGPGQTAGYPQMAPPPGIPWEQPQQAPVAPSPPPVMRNPNANMTDERVGNKARMTPGVSTFDKNNTLNNLGAAFMAWLDNSTKGNAGPPTITGPAAGSRAAAEAPDEAFQPHVLKRPGPGSAPSLPSLYNGPEVNQGLDQYGAPAGYGAASVTPPIPLDLGQLLYSDVPLPEPGARPATPPLPQQKGAPTAAPSPAKSAAPAASAGASNRGSPAEVAAPSGRRASNAPPFTGAPNTDDPFPQSSPLFDPLTQKFMLQTGLNLMVPQWGGPMANIGSAVGAGAEAVDNSQKADQATKLANAKVDVERARVAKIGLGKKGASESSSSKRLKAKTPAQEFAAGLSPEGSLYFTQRLKDLNKPGEDDSVTPDAKFQQIMSETQNVDRRARASRGMARSEEVPDALLQKVAGTPNEQQALGFVAKDPTQKALLTARLEAIKQAKAASSGGQPTK